MKKTKQMIKNIVRKILKPFKKNNNKNNLNLLGKYTEIKFSEHKINYKLIDIHAIKIVNELQKKGFLAYLVGGAVRDLLLNLKPKDFDIVTNATPIQIKRVFGRNAFIIGKRFRIVHVIFYNKKNERKVIEVSTFRALLDNSQAVKISENEEKDEKRFLLGRSGHAIDNKGMVLRDNVWGTIQEDAQRRDFTINALYYDPKKQVLIDFHNGFDDIKNRNLKIIGNPEIRYKEDPVRMLRAIRFTAKLSTFNFSLDNKSLKAINNDKYLIKEIAYSRLFDEILKLLQTGHSISSVEQLIKYKFSDILPLLNLIIKEFNNPLFKTALIETDKRIKHNKTVSSTFLFSCLLWTEVYKIWQLKVDINELTLKESIEEVLEKNADIFDSYQSSILNDTKIIWLLQNRFNNISKKSNVISLLKQKRFRLAFDFLSLRSKVGEIDKNLVFWWDNLQKVNEEQVLKIIDETSNNIKLNISKKKNNNKAKKPNLEVLNLIYQNKDLYFVKNALSFIKEHPKIEINLNLLYASLIWIEIYKNWQLNRESLAFNSAFKKAINEVIEKYKNIFHFKTLIDLKIIYSLQIRFENITKLYSVKNLLKDNRFDLAYNFLILRSKNLEVSQNLINWWSDILNNQENENELNNLIEFARQNKKNIIELTNLKKLEKNELEAFSKEEINNIIGLNNVN